MVNSHGAVIGVNTAMILSAQGERIGFSLPLKFIRQSQLVQITVIPTEVLP